MHHKVGVWIVIQRNKMDGSLDFFKDGKCTERFGNLDDYFRYGSIYWFKINKLSYLKLLM